MQFGTVLKRMRRGAGFSQEEMGLQLHLSKSTISRLEKDRIPLKAEDLLKWCKITNNPDVMMALYSAIDVSIQVQPITQLITGTILLGWF